MIQKVSTGLVVACLAASFIGGCKKEPAPAGGPAPAAAPGKAAGGKNAEYVFALIAKSNLNPVFQAARVGAEDAAKEVGEKLGVKIKMIWQTPNEDDAKLQSDYLEQMVLQGVDGIAISCVTADIATPAIDKAVSRGVPVMCFDSDAPKSKRFCFHGTDDFEAGRLIMRETAAVLGSGKHVVGIPGANQNAANIQNRIRGAQEEAKGHPNITLKGPYYFKETPQDGAAKIEEAQTANPDIDGWAMISAVAMFTDALMKWEPGKVKIVAMDALEAQLPYLKKGVVQKLWAQQTYKWGYRSIELLADKVILGKDPEKVLDYSPLLPVEAKDADAFAENWKKWLRK